MTNRKVGTGILLLAIAGGFSAWTFGQPGGAGKGTPPDTHAKTEEHHDEVEIKLADAPAPVRGAAAKVTAEKSVKKVIKETEDGVTTYEIEYTDNGADCSVTLSPAGDVLETEHGVTQDKVPAAAMATVKKHHPNASLGEIHLVTKTFYEVEIVTDGKKHEIKVNSAGEIEGGHKHEADEHKDGQKHE